METPEITTSERPESATTGSEFCVAWKNDASSRRDKAIVEECLSGNLPSSFKTLIPVVVSDGKNELTYFASSDVLAIGSDEDNVRVPLDPLSAQVVVDALGGILPTRKMVLDIWRQSEIKLTPSPLPYGAQMVSTDYFLKHHQVIQNQLKKFNATGKLVSGHKKDVVIFSKLTQTNKNVGIFGWIYPNGTVIQGLNTTSHDNHYRDYSHGHRFVHNICLLNGAETNIGDILQDPLLYKLVSDEGSLKKISY